MKSTVTSTELARNLGDVLARVRYRRESFVIERNGTPVARLIPIEGDAPTLVEAVMAWTTAAPHDAGFADDLERVNAADQPPVNPWDS